MKKVGVLALCLLLLTGCSSAQKEIERGMALRSSILKGNGCSFDSKITADYGDKTYTFSVEIQADSQGDITFTVAAPETISGITGRISQEGGMLTFDGTALHFDLMAEDQITPVIAPWILVKTLRSGYLRAACMEDDLLRLTIDDSYEEDALQLDIWINDKDQPVLADILYDGRRIVSMEVENFTVL